jgi:hypothetical protein
MLTVEQLIEFLQSAPKNARITNEQGEDIIHIHIEDGVVLGTKSPIAYCNRSGGYVYPTTTKGYYGYSIGLDEDVYQMETTPLDSDKNSQCN